VVEAELALTPAASRGDLLVDLDLGNGKHITATKVVDVPAAPARAAADFLGAVHAGGKGEARDKALAASQFFTELTVSVPRSDVELWWPAGLGAQPLYNMTVTFRPADGSMDCGAAMLAGEAGRAAAPFFRQAPPTGPLPPAAGDPAMRAAARRSAPFPAGESCTAVHRRVGFRTIEVVTQPGSKAAAGDLKASWDWLPAKGAPAPVDKSKLSAEARLLEATAAAATAKPEWTLYEGKWVFLDTPQVKDPKAPIEGESFCLFVYALCFVLFRARETSERAGARARASLSFFLFERARRRRPPLICPVAPSCVASLTRPPHPSFPSPPPRIHTLLPLKNNAKNQKTRRTCQNKKTSTGYNFTAHPSNALKPMVPAGNGKTRQAVATDGDTESFYFRVNGVPLFSKGSNLIPFTLFPTTDNYDQIERTLLAALAANHNTVRIWGGGIYQSDALHDLADEMGLLMWEEAMFACGSYPSALPGFLSNVKAEIAHQVRRVAGRPSVAIWGGNNEVEMSLDWFPNTRDNRMLYAVEYHELFIRTIGGVMRQLAPALHYLDSSATNGYAWHPPAGERSSDVLPVKRWGKPGDPRFGDVHFYNYAFDCEAAREFPRSKFVSEFGFLSVPNFETWAEATDPAKGDWVFGDFSPTKFGVNNTMTNYRSRRYSHAQEILNQAGRHFRLPSEWRAVAPAGASEAEVAAAAKESERLYRQFFWLTNQQQAACYRVGTAAWRRQRSESNALTMGVLYWQLNDVWAGWSWSGYDWAGRWKPMHYALKREFASLATQAFYDRTSDVMEVFAVSDEPVAGKDAQLVVTVHRLLAGAKGDGACAARPAAVAKTFRVSGVQVPAAAAARVWSMPADELLAQAPGCTRGSCYVTAKLTASYPALGAAWTEEAAAKLPSRPRVLSSSAEATIGYWKEVDAMPAAEIVADAFRQGADDRTVVFRVSEKHGATAALVTLDTPFPGSFDDNGFMLHAAGGGAGSADGACAADAGREVSFRSDKPMAPQELADALTITSLFDYQPAQKVEAQQ